MRGASPPRRRSPVAAYWLIAKDGDGPTEVLTVDLDGCGEALPVFCFGEEAEMFLRLGASPGVSSDGWRARESTCGELVSVLYGPCVGVESVVFDPLPGVVADGTAGYTSLDRERFVDLVLARGRPGGRPEKLPREQSLARDA